MSKGKSTKRHRARWLTLSLLAGVLSLLPFSASAKKPKKALKEGDARRAVAATPGFGLNRGVVKIKDISLAGESPVVVKADVEVALGFTKAEGEKTEDGSAAVRWVAAEFRTGDRAWELFEDLGDTLGAAKIEDVRATLEEMAAEFVVKERERKLAKEREKEGRTKEEADAIQDGDAREKPNEAKGEKKDEKKDEEKIEVRRGPVAMKEFAPMYKSARAVVTVEAAFRLEKDTKGKWQVAEFTVGDASFGNFNQLIAALDRKKAARARRDLDTIREALEAFRRERGFYVVAEDEAVLIDHLAPLYLKTVIRIDPWHRPYRYEGARERYTLSSDGPDGKPSTSDDVTINGGR